MELLNAKEMANKVVIDESFLKEITKKINENAKSGRIAINCGWRWCSAQAKSHAINVLKSNGYGIGFSTNCHGVDRLIVTW